MPYFPFVSLSYHFRFIFAFCSIGKRAENEGKAKMKFNKFNLNNYLRSPTFADKASFFPAKRGRPGGHPPIRPACSSACRSSRNGA